MPVPGGEAGRFGHRHRRHSVFVVEDRLSDVGRFLDLAERVPGPAVASDEELDRRSDPPAEARLRLHVGIDLGPFEIDLTSGSALDTMGGSGFKAISALVGCAMERKPIPPSLRRVEISSYYATTLHILSLIAVQERYPECL